MTVLVQPDLAASWIDVGAIEDIPLRGARRVMTADGDIAVFRTHDDRIFALRDRCPHKQGPLSQGIVHGHAVACPLHNWTISLQTGQAMGADAGNGCTPTVAVQVEGGRIFIGGSG
jgi:nitrite reductase (NADH) small subunit